MLLLPTPAFTGGRFAFARKALPKVALTDPV